MPTTDSRIYFDKSSYILYQPYRGLQLVYHAKKFYFSHRSKYQQIDIIENDAYGRMLFLDNNLQHTAYDATIFNEALCGRAKRNHAHSLIVLGGGSGQTLVSLLKSEALRHVTLVEIDPTLVEACTKHIRGVNRAFVDPRVKVCIANAFEYLHSMSETYDAAIIDLTERPLGMGKMRSTLAQVYSDIRAKCNRRCSQYVGSSVDLAGNTRFRSEVIRASKEILGKVEIEDVFIPSFGAPHTFVHAGFER